MKENSKIKAVEVEGKHGVSSDKFEEVFKAFKEAIQKHSEEEKESDAKTEEEANSEKSKVEKGSK